MADAETANNLITLLFGTSAGGAGLGVAGKMLYDWFGSQRNGVPMPAAAGEKTAPVPHAKNGFMSLQEIEDHCTRQQKACQNLIRKDIELFLSKVDARLDRGDRQFDAIETRLHGISTQIARTHKEGT